MPFFAQEAPTEGYDRLAASRVLAELAFPGLLPSPDGPVDAAFSGPPRQIQYRTAAMVPEPGSHLTAAPADLLVSRSCSRARPGS